jgi:sulfur-carrier protein adenylyltransferase/sulfurtransferase
LSFTEDQVRRYARHIILPGIGGDGQQRLMESRVLVIGAGGLGSPAAMYLAAAGVGTIGLVDFDSVELSNLQRQLLHDTADVGRPKVESARDRLTELNPNVEVVVHETLLSSGNAFEVLGGYDVVLDGTDNFPVRYLVNDATQMLGIPLVYGSIYQWEGQASVFLPGQETPCYRCLFPEPPPPGTVPSCAEGGVFGVLPGIIGSIQAVEAIKLVLDVGESLVGKLLLYDAMTNEFTTVKLRWDPDCPVCGKHPTVTELIDYEAFCGLTPGQAPPEAERTPAASEGAP